jgi:hypothetical protein
MKVVYFDQSISTRAPDLIGMWCTDPGATWITGGDIMAALERGEPVEIRPASEAERQRAESAIVLLGIGWQLASSMGSILDSSIAAKAADLGMAVDA